MSAPRSASPPPTFAHVLDAVGPRLRALRAERSTTLAELSAATGISVSTLSRLEAGQRRPTLELLLPIAAAHQVPVDQLLPPAEPADPRVHTHPTTQRGMTFQPLTRRPGGVRAMKVTAPPGTPTGEPEQQSHEGYEWMYVLSGELRLLLGEHDFTLAAGEVAEFDTRTPHWFGNAGTVPAEVIILFGPQGERMHVRARPRRAAILET